MHDNTLCRFPEEGFVATGYSRPEQHFA